jgi:YlmC/YmxH family sporulation protein
MRLSSLGEKEIVNLSDGGRFGLLADSELLVDEKYGKIKAILLPDYRYQKSIFSGKNFMQVPWSSIKKIGSDIIIFESTEEIE